jgi:hypothetical protein
MTLCLIMLLLAQERIQSYSYNGMGQPVAAPTIALTTSGAITTATEKTQSLNGRTVPLERTEQRVLRDDGHTRVVEKYIRRYDPNGNLAGSEKVLIEEEKRADGASSTRTTVYRGDVNGNMALSERSRSESRKQGDRVNTAETVERPSINGSLEVAEKRDVAVQKTPEGELTNTQVFRRGENGGFIEASQQVSERKDSKAGSVENVTTYESASTGKLALVGQTVRKTVKGANGSETVEVDIYTRDVPGLASDAVNPAPRLREQQIIERRASGGQQIETVDVRRPTIADPNRLGPARRISKTVCQGKCDAESTVP